MKKIRLAFRIVIDGNSEMLWDRYIFEDTWFEYKIQHQVFDDQENPVKNYWELLQKNPNTKQIPFLLSGAISTYVAQLEGEIKSLPDVLGTTFFPFENFKLDVISSHTEDVSKHKVGLTFFSPELILLDIIDQKYLLSKEVNKENSFETFMMPFHPQVAISYVEFL